MERAAATLLEREEAASWYERLHRDRVPDDARRDFEAWLAVSPAHRQAYESVERTWGTLQQAAVAPEILALRHETALRLTRRTSAGLQPRRWAAAAAVVFSLIVGAVLINSSERSSVYVFLASLLDKHHEHYQTAIGERLAFTLPDGSQVTLDTQSDLTTRFSPTARLVELTRGQAFFEVTKDPRRPFIVATRSRQFVAVGTAFDVRIDADRVKITMVEGTVRVEPAADQLVFQTPAQPSERQISAIPGGAVRAPTAPTRRSVPISTITAGEQLVSDAHHGDRVRAIDPDRDTSWRRGQVIFENTRLAEAVEEINRYSETKIELADPSLASLPLSGAFATGRPDVFVEALTSYFPVRVADVSDRRIVLRQGN